MGRKFVAAASAVTVFATSAAIAQVARPTVNVPVLKPVIKGPTASTSTPTPTTPAPSGPTYSQIPAHFTTPTLEFIGTVPGTEPTKSPDIIANAAPAGAEPDFTITVPVVVKNMPPIYTAARAICYVTLAMNQAAPDTYALGPQASSNWVARVPLTGGGFAGNAVLRFNVDPGFDARAARIYVCSLSFEGTDRGNNFTSRPSGGFTGPVTYTPPIASASPPTAFVHGIVP